ncbi:MAG: 2-oxoacid:acceptor oxidoreductase family protein [Endomicrobium sp.]|jgi:2-oxoglutarate ferredoxin oxidoreductase subunit gamma|nr:2-oxoacid:acceptor oxidoreductase family protein [Endomicrobium sp.]
MRNEIVIAGFGGQGVLLAGILIAQAAIEQGLHTTWFPSYGAEKRGGTANSTVIVSSEEIGSPLALNPEALIILNEPALNKFAPKAAKGAVIITNSSIIAREGKKYDSKFYFIPITDIADKEIKNLKTANMVAVGSLIKALKKRFSDTKEMKETEEETLTLGSILDACEKVFASKQNLIEINKKAIQAGYDFIN